MGCLCREIAGPDIELSQVCLGQMWMFDNLSQADLTQLIQAAQRKNMAKGDVLFLQSDPADDLFLIKAGRIKLVKVFEDGSELTAGYSKRW